MEKYRKKENIGYTSSVWGNKESIICQLPKYVIP